MTAARGADAGLADAARDGRIVASHGRDVLLEDASGERVRCRLRGRKLSVVCGDRVRWMRVPTEGGAGVVTERLGRSTLLARLNLRGEAEPVAANLSQLVAVVAPLPEPDLGLCDRYVAAAEWARLKAVVVANKADLPGDGDSLARALADYRRLGYPVVQASIRGAPGAGALAARLAGETSVLVGQSGVGKSSLTNALVPGVEAAVDEVSRATETGRHTTSAAMLYRLPGGGELIDSPGVRDFAPPLPPPRGVAGGFREIAGAAADCRFRDCLHRREPGCAVAAGVRAGAIAERRLTSYRRLLDMAEDAARIRR